MASSRPAFPSREGAFWDSAPAAELEELECRRMHSSDKIRLVMNGR